MQPKPIEKSAYQVQLEMADDIHSIKGWVTFFGVMAILAMILGFGLSFCGALM